MIRTGRTAALSWLLLFFLLAAGSAAAQAPSHAEEKFKQIQALDKTTFKLPEKDRIAKIKDLYERLFSGSMDESALRKADDKDLAFIYKATGHVTFYTGNPADFRDMQLVLQEIERRKLATDEQRSSLYRAMIGLRQFEVARKYLSAHPGLDVEPVPEIGSLSEKMSRPVIYLVSPHRNFLQPTYFDLDHGTKLVVVSHPLCGFSRRAMETLAADGELAPIIRRHATWLAPVAQRLDVNEIREWNHEHPATNVVIARDQSEWPMFDSWATPRFYLLKDGKLLDQFSGWPQDGEGRKRLTELLSKGGLLTRRPGTEAKNHGVSAADPAPRPAPAPAVR